MFFRQLIHEEKSCLSYIVGCPTYGVAAVFDAQKNIDLYLDICKRYLLKITHILETHVQADHLSGAYGLSQKTGATVYFHQSAAVKFPHEKLNDRDTIKIGNRQIKAMHTPGHTPDSVCYYVDDWFLITGDTLFVGDVGRVDLSLEINDKETVKKARTLYKSIKRLMKLSDYIEIYPGHFSGSACGKHMDGKPTSTIGREKRDNYALKLKNEDSFVKFVLTNQPMAPTDYRKIKRRNMSSRLGKYTLERRSSDWGKIKI